MEIDRSHTGEEWDQEYDLVVLGSGAAGLTAAVVASAEGLQALVVEKTDFFGGTTAYSAGTCWIPNNRFMRALGVEDDETAADQYLELLVGPHSPREMRRAFLSTGPEMLAYLEVQCGVGFRPYTTFVDYHPELSGAGMGSRPLEPLPFDGRKLGDRFRDIRWPVPEWGLFGGKLSVLRSEVARLLKIVRLSPDAVLLGLQLVLRYAADRLRYPRGTRLVLGNALVANLYYSLLERGGEGWLNARASRILMDKDRVEGLLIQHGGRELRIRARRGVVLAGGGFPANPEWRDRYLRQPAAQFTRACDGCTGDTIALAQTVGAALGPERADNALWFPSSIGKRGDGSTVVFPHIWDRAKPGLVAINRAGRRFVDESVSYHEFTRAMYATHQTIPAIPAILVCDRRFLWKYGLGMVRPLTPSVDRYVKAGYLYSAPTLRALAEQIGVDPDGLAETIAANNQYSETGVDMDFHKGESPYGRQYGDPDHRPNPCLGPIERAPYFALPVVPTPLGTALGLRVAPSSEVLSETGRPIGGLYACGGDAQSIMGGEYPGGGCQVASAMTFGYIAARHAADGRGQPSG
jgi:succinate dehydrogenase/fumarate reductase flavoprotein subunit